jgi:multisubunit Na+/H+ antiporter MnhC subunit
MEAVMKNRTKDLIFRLTAVVIGLAVTSVVFVAVAHSPEAPIVAQATAGGS